MGGLAAIAKAAGYRVTGCDANVYPPMSEQLAALGIELIEGYDSGQLKLAPDMWVIGNVVTRGNPLMEAILDRGERYVSGPQWLAEEVLHGKWVLAVAGTHGKTTLILHNDVLSPCSVLFCRYRGAGKHQHKDSTNYYHFVPNGFISNAEHNNTPFAISFFISKHHPYHG